jgi:hypothetical protein
VLNYFNVLVVVIVVDDDDDDDKGKDVPVLAMQAYGGNKS